MTKRINYYFEGRIFEWAMGMSMILVGLEIIIWPATIESSAFKELSLLISNDELIYFLLFFGWIRCCALMLNGQRIFGIKMGPYVRAGCSIGSAFIWVQFTMALIELSMVQGYPSPGIPFWSMFTLGELYATYTTVKNG